MGMPAFDINKLLKDVTILEEEIETETNKQMPSESQEESSEILNHSNLSIADDEIDHSSSER